MTGLTIAGTADTNGLTASQKPNIIFVLIDDMGWNHHSARQPTTGHARDFFKTPTIEHLANSGLSFTHCYSQPNCAPSRACLLTGQYPCRINNDIYTVGNLNRFIPSAKKKAPQFTGPEQSNDVAPTAITVAEALQRNGYATAHIGKYHVGGSIKETMPENSGFDINIGGGAGGVGRTRWASQTGNKWGFKGGGHFDKYAEPYTEEYLTKYNFPLALNGKPKHVSDAMGDALENTIKTLADGKKPFYLQFHTYAVHKPASARPDLKEAAAKRSRGHKESVYEYAGFVSGVDVNLKRLFSAIRDPNGDGDTSDSIEDNTLLIFSSDNGGISADNKPLKGVKGMFTEGGIRVPLIAYWKGRIPANTISNKMVHFVDFYPTFLELAGNSWRPDENEHPLDGESFADLLFQPDVKAVRKPIFYLYPGYTRSVATPCTVAIGDLEGKRYKLSYSYETDSWELYCLTDDIGERENLVTERKDIAADLASKLHHWLKQEHPTWNPKYPINKETGKPQPLPEFNAQ